MDRSQRCPTLRLFLPKTFTRIDPDGTSYSVCPSIGWTGRLYKGMFGSIKNPQRVALQSIARGAGSSRRLAEKPRDQIQAHVQSIVEEQLKNDTADSDFTPTSPLSQRWGTGGLYMLLNDPKKRALDVHGEPGLELVTYVTPDAP
jgi:hypothetical protein